MDKVPIEIGEMLKELRYCIRPSAVLLARRLNIPRSTAHHRIKQIETQGHVRGYLPILNTQGLPTYLMQIRINREDFLFDEDSMNTLGRIKEYLKQCQGFALLATYWTEDKQQILLSSVIFCYDSIQKILDDLCQQLSIDHENIEYFSVQAEGIPDFGPGTFSQGEIRNETD